MMHLVLIVVIFNESTIASLNGRYYGLHTVYLQLFTELMDAIGPIGKNKLGIYTLNERERLADIRTGTRCNNDSDRQCASTAKCILVLNPLLCGPCPDYRLLFLPHGDVPYNEWSQS